MERHAEQGQRALAGTSRAKQIWLLVKKNFILQKRRPVGTLLEILVPTLFFFALIGVRSVVTSTTRDAQVYCSLGVSPLDTVRPLMNADSRNSGNNNDNVYGMAPNNQIPYQCSQWPNNIDFAENNNNDSPTSYNAIAFAPNNAQTQALMLKFKTWFNVYAQNNDRLQNFTFVGMDTAEQVGNIESSSTYKFALGIVFQQDNNGEPGALGISANNKIHYTFRMPDSMGTANGNEGWQTARNFPEFEQLGPRREYSVYMNSGFAMLQSCMDIAIMQFLKGSDELPNVVTRLKMMPFPSWEDDGFIFAIRTVLPLFLVLSYQYTAVQLTRSIVLEKERRLKEALKMMGLAGWIHWFSWFLKSAVFLFITVVIIVIIFQLGQLAKHSANGYIFLLLWFFSLSLIFFCFAISVFFTTASVASSAGGIIYFMAYVPYFFIAPRYETMTRSQKGASCLLPPTCLGIGTRILSQWESAGKGLTAETVDQSPTDEGNFSMNDVYGMLIADCIIYMVVAWYVEAIHPGKFGIPRKPWFFLLPSYWLGPRAHAVADGTHALDEAADVSGENFEPGPSGRAVGISIDHMTKVFKGVGGTHIAVNNLSLDMYHGQITALLGHNGAGKSTLLSMVVGMFPPTSGTAVVNGYDVRENTEQVRRSLGLCPQFDVLWDELTVAEHLRFFGELKGKGGRELENEIDHFLDELNLTSKRNEQSKTLSGGQKRALSVALALVGDPAIVILDEPSSGMDPYKRRQTWDLLLRHKEGRTIILTTHFMDEADLLGDRIAILAEGRLKCLGTSMFLKNRFGVGYHMTMVKESNCDTARVESLVSSAVPGAVLEADAGAELSFLLPQHETASFPTLFSSMDANQQRLGIASYGISVTTMEEVFLRVGQGENASLLERRAAVQKQKLKRENTDTSVGDTKVTKLTGWGRRFAQLKAMTVKKYLHSLRHHKTLIAQLLLPVLFAIAAMAVATTTPSYSEPSRLFKLDNYRANTVLQSSLDTGGDSYTGAFPITQEQLQATGNTTATPIRTALLNRMQTFIGTNSLQSQATPENISGRNFSDSILTWSKDYVSNNFFKDNYVAYTYGPGIISIRRDAATGACEALVGTSWVSTHTFNLEVNQAYHFRLFKNSSDNAALFLATDAAGSNQLTSTRYEYEQYGGNSFQTVYFSRSTPTSSGLFMHCEFGGPTSNIVVNVIATGGDAVETATAYGWFNNGPYHTIPLAINIMDTVTLQEFIADANAQIFTYNHPLPKSLSSTIDELRSDANGFNLALFIVFGLGFAAASFCVLLVTERVSHAKHLQLVSGVNRTIFWLGTYLWDFVLLLIMSFCIMIVFAAFDVPAFRGDNMGVVLLLLILFAWAALPLIYLLAFFFDTASSAYARLSMLLIFLGMAFVIIIFVFSIPALNLESEGKIMKKVFYFLPNYAVAQSFLDMYYNYNYNDICTSSASALNSCQTEGYHFYDNYLDMSDPGVGLAAVMMFVWGIFYWFLLMLVDFGVINMLRGRYTAAITDRRNTLENQYFEEVHVENPVVEVDSLSKVYKMSDGSHKAVVNNLNFSVKRGECFGLLGVNGAGKSTTFRMLMGEEVMTVGTVIVAGHNIQTDTAQARESLGFCPQYEGLIPTMTGVEHLMMFGRLRGIPESRLPALVDEMINKLDLKKHAHKLSEAYSGGNKRKLSTAIALIGSPDVVFLDEPSSGVDVGARRFIWDALTEFLAGGHSIIITSHSMEECEALCTRIAIMVDGQFECLGSVQKLKNTFSSGYTAKIKASPAANNVPQVKAFVEQSFPDSEFKEEHNGECTYQIKSEARGWAYIFAQLETAKRDLAVSDYSVSQTTLEQVFLGFAAHQADSANKSHGNTKTTEL
eukprot:m.229564 g.229564  ORF g.229564 m.229564 type:complete len:1857 (+) comp22401_c4_seq1:3439-9009(+)